MLRNVLLIATTSGLPLFSQEFLNSVAQPRLVGSLLTIMMELAIRTTSLPATYIELANVAVTIVRDETVQVCCALFHDRSDGPTFGKLVATQILFAFLEEYSGDFGSLVGNSILGAGDDGLDSSTGGTSSDGGGLGRSVTGMDSSLFSSNLRDFHGFRMKISRAVTGCIQPVLGQLQAHRSRGILRALVVMEEGTIQSGGSSDRFDQLAILANLQAMLSFAGELLAGHRDDTCSQIILDSGPIKGTRASDSLDTGVTGSEAEENIGNLLRTRTTARRIGRAIFIVVVDKDVQSEQYRHALDDTERILTKICAVIYDNQLMRRE